MPIPKTKFCPPVLRQPTLVSPVAIMVAGPFADQLGIQLWFLIAGISCLLMGVFGFFSSDVMEIENKASEDVRHVISPSV